MHLKILFILLFIPSVSFSKQGDWINKKTLDAQYVYDATFEACSKINPKDMRGGSKYDRLYAGIFPSKNFNTLTNSIQREALAKNTIYFTEDDKNENSLWLVNSPGFKYAVNECFPNTEDQKRFIWLVAKRERAGKILGNFISFVGVGKFFSSFSKIYKAGGKALNYSTLIGVASVGSYSLYLNVAQHKYIAKKCGEIVSKECAIEAMKDLQ